MSRLAPLSTLFLLATLGGEAQALQRWNVDVLGLEVRFHGWDEPNPRISYLDAHGYFTGEDRDRDGAITFAEVAEIELTQFRLAHYPFSVGEAMYAPNYTQFRYTPGDGLSLTGDGYRTNFVFGSFIGRYADTGSLTYTWVEGTQTLITAVPEPAALTLAMGGMGLAWACAKRRRAPTARGRSLALSRHRTATGQLP